MTKHNRSKSTPGTVPAIVVAALFAVASLLANLPGNPIVGPHILADGKYGPHFECGVESMVHGWPFTCLRHDGRYTLSGDGPSAWHVGDNAHFAPAALAANVALIVAGTFVIGWIVRRRIQRNGWRFGVIYLMAAMLFVSAVAAFITSRYRQHQAQIAHLQRAHQNIHLAEWQPYGPHWLRRITGPRCWDWGDRLVAADVEHSDEIAELPGRRTIKVLRITTVRCDAIPPLDDYDNLMAIDMCMVSYDYSNFDGGDDPHFWPCLRVIAQCDSLQGLNLYDTGLSDRGLKELARMPNLTNLELSANPDVTDDGLAHLASLKSLRKLGLWDTGVTQTGVEKLQLALPDCEIGWDGMSPGNNVHLGSERIRLTSF